LYLVIPAEDESVFTLPLMGRVDGDERKFGAVEVG
jgi:hypothetical protein